MLVNNGIEIANISCTLEKHGKLPEYSDEDAAGADLFLNLKTDDTDAIASLSLKSILHRETFILRPRQRVTLSVGVSFAIPKGLYGKIFDRSGLASKNGLLTTGGVIDSNYRGVVKVILTNNDFDKNIEITHHMKIAQIVFQPYVKGAFNQVDSLEATIRGNKGFGSTGV